MLARLRRKAFAHAALAIGTTKEELQGLLSTALTEGQSIQQLAKSIDDYFDLASKVRSLRIARTELTDTINDGVHATLAEEGYREKEWTTVIDGRERETHQAADGQVVGMDGVFTVGGASCHYPGDEILPPSERIQCRCTLVAAGTPDDRRRQMGRAFLRAHGSLERTFVVALAREFGRQRRRVLSHFPS